MAAVTNARVSKQTPSKKGTKKEFSEGSFASMMGEASFDADPLFDGTTGMDFDGEIMFP